MKTLAPCDHDECPPTRCTQTASDEAVVCKELLGEIIVTLNDALNWWYPAGTQASTDERESRQRLFDLRDKLELLKHVSSNDQVSA